jgi:hypothetical protein
MGLHGETEQLSIVVKLQSCIPKEHDQISDVFPAILIEIWRVFYHSSVRLHGVVLS